MNREARSLRQRLESLAMAGVQQMPKLSRGVMTSGATPPGPKPSGLSAAASPPSAANEAFRPLAVLDPAAASGRADALDVARREVAACTRCAELAAGRTHTVFGSGSPAARICFMGEAPGADEDATGEPFVGRAGQLLTKIIEACTLSRDDVYIFNVLKCRPPGNRPPLPEEVANCRGYFERQLAIIDPAFIVCLGASAAQSLLQTTESIGKLRGRWLRHGNADVLCTYHPSYLLRNPAAKRDVWEDMKLLMARAGLGQG